MLVLIESYIIIFNLRTVILAGQQSYTLYSVLIHSK